CQYLPLPITNWAALVWHKLTLRIWHHGTYQIYTFVNILKSTLVINQYLTCLIPNFEIHTLYLFISSKINSHTWPKPLSGQICRLSFPVRLPENIPFSAF